VCRIRRRRRLVKILLTGGAGFIGSNIADGYLEAGHEILVIDDLSSGKKENVPAAARFVLCDINSETAAEAIRTFRPEVVNHHAAQINVRASVADPMFDAQVNILGTIRLLEACRQNGVRKILFASSGGAGYGEQETFPADENHPTRPVSPYGAAKIAAELYLNFYRAQYGLDYTALRYGNVYGPRQDPHGEAGVVAIFCERFLKGQTAIVNGDGEQTRDYVYVGDAVRANIAALERGVGCSINIATGIETNVNTIFRTLRDLSGSSQEEIHGPPMPGEQRRSCLENLLALEELGWYPEISLEEGLARTLSFFREKIRISGTW
jgi:UDP-glucose 4-epimerase